MRKIYTKHLFQTNSVISVYVLLVLSQQTLYFKIIGNFYFDVYRKLLFEH